MSTNQVSATPTLAEQLRDPAYSAYLALRTVFTIAPIVFGLDKFFNLLTHPHHWSMYLAGWIDDLVPGTADQCMYLVGIIEIVAGVVVAVAPRLGAWVVAAWLAGIIIDLVTGPVLRRRVARLRVVRGRHRAGPAGAGRAQRQHRARHRGPVAARQTALR